MHCLFLLSGEKQAHRTGRTGTFSFGPSGKEELLTAAHGSIRVTSREQKKNIPEALKRCGMRESTFYRRARMYKTAKK